jgi:RNA polymerase sigma-70 factor (ECF subfamily)
MSQASGTDPKRAALDDALRRMAARDAGGLERFYDLLGGLVFGLSLKMLRSREEAEDLTQEVFLYLWKEAARYDASRGTPTAWAVTVTRSRAIDRIRSRDSEARRMETIGAASPGSAPDETGRDAERNETAASVRSAMAALPAEHRTMIELAYFEGLSQSQIAKRLGEPLGTIKSRARAALFRLRDTLEGSRA